MAEQGWQLTVWGPLRLAADGEPVELRPRERAVLASLAARHPTTSSINQIIDLIWGDAQPATARKSVQNHVKRIRAAAGEVIITTDTGYRLNDSVTIDASIVHADDEPFVDLADTEAVAALRSDAEVAQHRDALASMSARVETGTSADDVAQIEQWLARQPDDERILRLHARALASNGRRRDALAAIRATHRAAALAGRGPDRMLRDLERRLLDDDPTLSVNVPDGAEPLTAAGHVVALDGYVERIEASIEGSAVSLIAVTGPAGIGKTTLVEHIRDRADRAGQATLMAACSPEPSIPLEPFTEILHQLAERYPDAIAALDDRDVLRSLVPTLVEEAPPPGTPRPDRSVLLAAVSAALRCAPDPLTVVFEDLHWATALTQQMLRACLEPQTGSPLRIIVTSRDADVPLVDLADEHVVVKPWTADDVEAYIARFGRDSSWCRHAAEWIHRQSGGTALFIRELTVAAHATPPGAAFEPPTSTPDNLRASLRRTLRSVSASTQRDLGAAAVLGRRFSLSEWSALAARPEQSASEAIEAGILEWLDQGQAAFRHDLLHRVVLDDMSSGLRVELHDLAIDAIQQSASLEGGRQRYDELARHAHAAAVLDHDRAVIMLQVAIQADLERFDYESGIDRCHAALELLAHHELDRTTVEFEARLGQLQLRVGDPEALDQLLTAARHALDLGDDDLVAETMREACRLGPTSVVGAVHAEAGELLDRANESVRDPRAASAVATAGVMLYAISGEYERCRAYFERAVTYRGDDATRLDALALAVLVLTEPDDFDRRVDLEREMTGLAQSVGSEEGRWGAAHLRMTNQVQTGNSAMRETLVELGELTTTLRQRTRVWEYTNWAASVALTDGDPDTAEALATEALACIDAVAESLVMSAYGAQLLSIRHAQGRVGELFETVAAIVDAGDAIGAWHGVLALAAADVGDTDRARSELDLVVADEFAVLDRDYTFNGAIFAAALAACEIGAVDIAERLEPELAKWSGRWAFVGTCTMGPIDFALGRVHALLDRNDTAREFAQQSLVSAEDARAPIYAAQAAVLLESLDSR